MEQQNEPPKWSCHLHPKSNCSIVFENNKQFHINTIKDVDKIASVYNTKNIPNEFWEDLGENICYVSAIAYTNWINRMDFVVDKVFKIFQNLDENGYYFASENKPSDFIKSHLVVSPCGNVRLCNLSLLRGSKISKKRYSTNSWKKRIIKSLFPKLFAPKNKIATDIPAWVTIIYNELGI